MAYALSILSGEAALSSSTKTLSAKSVENYLYAAARLSTDAYFPDPRYAYDIHGNRIGCKWFKQLDIFFDTIKKWTRSRTEALPLTNEMILYLVATYPSLPADSLEQCCTDAVILGCFTGGRCSEYCKGKTTKGQAFGRVPVSMFTGTFGHWPIAITPHDMKFYSADLTLVPASIAHVTGAFVLLRFRFDKGGSKNFSERMYRRLPAPTSPLARTFCPLLTCLRIYTRWARLSGDPLTPVVCYRNKRGKVTYLADKSLTEFLRSTVIAVYPDPSHMYRLRIKDIRTHCLRVTALLLLIRAGYSDPVIEHKLRWASQAWKVYMREDLFALSDATIRLFTSAFTAPSTLESTATTGTLDNVTDTRD